jgi:hypothetical protein
MILRTEKRGETHALKRQPAIGSRLVCDMALLGPRAMLERAQRLAKRGWFAAHV